MPDKRGNRKQARATAKASSERQPLSVAPVSSERHPTSKPAPAWGKQHLSWRFAKADPAGPWCFGDCTGPVLHDIIGKLTSFESMMIEELLGDTLKSYNVEDIPTKEARQRLVDLRLDDQTALYRLRLTGTARLYGLMYEDAVFHVLWWDPDHEVWPSPKKHT